MVMIVVSFFGVGICGGFVQAGVGLIIITALLVHGLDLVHNNAIKVFVVFIYTFVALGVFIYHGQVDYSLGIALAIGNSIGGVIGVRLAVDKGHEWIKKVATVKVLIFSSKLLIHS